MFVVVSSSDGSGTDLIHMIRLAFSVLNRLLLLRPDDAPPSPVEHCLSAQPANRSVPMTRRRRALSVRAARQEVSPDDAPPSPRRLLV